MSDTSLNRHVVLVGAMGSGKTTIGVPLAVALGRPFVDNDDALVRSAGHTAADFEAREGIDALHDTEAAIVLDALRAPVPSVIAAAASTVSNPIVRDALARYAFVVWLRVAPATLAARMPQSSARPLARENPAQLVAQQGRERDPIFERIADLEVSTDGTGPDSVVTRIVEYLSQPR